MVIKVMVVTKMMVVCSEGGDSGDSGDGGDIGISVLVFVLVLSCQFSLLRLNTSQC